MIKEIKYAGYSAVPSDYECQDGDLAQSFNMINDGSGLSCIRNPKTLFSGLNNHKVYIHKIVGNRTNLLVFNRTTKVLEWRNTNGNIISNNIHTFDEDIISISAIGMIVVFSCASNVHYIRFNGNANAYIYLGTKVPDIILDFELKLNFTSMEKRDLNMKINDDTTTPDDVWTPVANVSYDLSADNGDLTHDNVTNPSLRNTWIASKFIPFDSSVVLHAGQEYKFTWDITYGWRKMTLSIWGYKNDSSEREQITGMAVEITIQQTMTTTKIVTDEWSNISYHIEFIGREIDLNTRIKGGISVFSGVEATTSSFKTIAYDSDSFTGLTAGINSFLKHHIVDKSRFCYPFFLRYAVRLFDGSYARISAPILLIPNSQYVPAISYYYNSSPSQSERAWRVIYSAFAADIQYRLISQIREEWSEIIAGIDFFVSQSAWSYDQGNEYDPGNNLFEFSSFVNSTGYGSVFYDDKIIAASSVHSLYDYIKKYAKNTGVNEYFISVSKRNADNIRKSLLSLSNFYKIASLDIEEISKASSFQLLKINEGDLESLVTREPLDCSVLPYDGYKNAKLNGYNNRLNVFGSDVILPHAFQPSECNGQFGADKFPLFIKAYVYLKTIYGDRIVESNITHMGDGAWYFYPDSRAYKVTFSGFNRALGAPIVATLPLLPHDFLNGSYWLGENWITIGSHYSYNPSSNVPSVINNSVPALASIYVSEANNPFCFSALNVVNVGVHEVKALASAAKALSQGQFGSFPLYAFTDEGVWALEVNGTGSFSARQPFTRDVLLSRESICQLDSAVLFASERGLMLISGSSSECICTSIDSEQYYCPANSYNLNSVSSFATLSIPPFKKFLQNCVLTYDYVNQRIFVSNSLYRFSHVYSLRSRLWGLTETVSAYSVNSYPNAYIITPQGHFKDLSNESDNMFEGLLVTRPIKLDIPDVLKTIDTIIQRGNFQKGHVKSVLLGSRDLIHWHLVWSSKDHFLRGFRGTPYKYFQIALICNLDANESIIGASVQFNPRLTNRPR